MTSEIPHILLRPIRLNSVLNVLLIISVILLLAGCSDEDAWTDEEKANSRYILLSMDEKSMATKIGNQPTGDQITALNQEDAIRLRGHTQQAYKYAQLVTDKVLDKAHPELRQHWRNEYQQGLRLTLNGWESGDPVLAIRGQILFDKHIEWWNDNRVEIKIPR